MIMLYHHISIYIIIYHHISSYIIIYHHIISFYIIIYHHILSNIINLSYHILSYSNNDARSEDLLAAIEVDHKLEKAWAGHPHHIIIDNHNSKSFDAKLQELVGAISHHVGLPSLIKNKDK